MARYTYQDWWKNSLQDNVNHATSGGILSDNTLKMHLYTSPSTGLTGAEVLASFTEAAFTGYSAVSLTGFGTVALSGTSYAYSTGINATFTATGAYQTIYGYFVTNAAGTVLYAAEDFSAAIVLSSSVNTIIVTPQMSRQQS